MSDYATRFEVQVLRRELAELRALVGRLSRRRENPDARLGAVLALIHTFAHATTWTAGELIEDARQAGDSGRCLWSALDAIVGPRGDPAIRLGRWLERHEGIPAEGYYLQRVKREGGCWLYAVNGIVE